MMYRMWRCCSACLLRRRSMWRERSRWERSWRTARRIFSSRSRTRTRTERRTRSVVSFRSPGCLFLIGDVVIRGYLVSFSGFTEGVYGVEEKHWKRDSWGKRALPDGIHSEWSVKEWVVLLSVSLPFSVKLVVLERREWVWEEEEWLRGIFRSRLSTLSVRMNYSARLRVGIDFVKSSLISD